MSFFVHRLGVPVIQRTTPPSIVGTPVWYAEASTARTTLDINITIPDGNACKLIVLWGSNGGEWPIPDTGVIFDPAGVAFPMIPIEGAFGQIGSLRIGAYYLDTPPAGANVVRFVTANAVRSVVSAKVYQNARADVPSAVAVASSGNAISSELDNETVLLDAFPETCDLVLGLGLSDGQLTPMIGQTAGADDVVNAAFLATTSNRTHTNNGSVSHGWAAAASADLLMAAVNILFSLGQDVDIGFKPLSVWTFDGHSLDFPDAEGRSPAVVAPATGIVVPGIAPLLDDDGNSVSVQGAIITAAHDPAYQAASYTIEAYFQPRSLPADGANRPIFGKDTGLYAPGGVHLELYRQTGDAAGSGRLRAYIRPQSGLAGTAIWIEESATTTHAYGTVNVNVAHAVWLTYDNATTTAKLYHCPAGGSVTLLASKTDANFFGLTQNTTSISIGCRSTSIGVEQDGMLDQSSFFAGAMPQASIEARAAAAPPVTIADPTGTGVITAVADNVGNVPSSTTTDVDVLLNDTGTVGPHYDIEIVSNPAGRLSVINDQTATAKIRITTPAAPTATTNESDSYRVRQGTSPDFGNASNTVSITWARQGSGGNSGGYTPHLFETRRFPSAPYITGATNPHFHGPSGGTMDVRARPPYSPSNPPSAAKICPMSGLTFFRITPNRGTAVLINNTTNSGLNWPAHLKPSNNPHSDKTWSPDGRLLYFTETSDRTSDPPNKCRSALMDIDGSRSGGPYRFLRASGVNSGLGDHGVASNNWFWDLADPNGERAYVLKSDGCYRYFPLTGNTSTKLFGYPSGYGNFHVPNDGNAQSSYDGRWHNAACRRNSDGRWGGIRVDLVNGTFGTFRPHPTSALDTNARAIHGTAGSGPVTNWVHAIEGEIRSIRGVNMDTGELSPIWSGSDRGLAEHAGMFMRNGRAYYLGGVSSIWKSIDLLTGELFNESPDNLGQAHVCTRNFKDTRELVGTNSAGVGTAGLRYGLLSISYDNNSRNTGGALMGLRLGVNDKSQWRWLVHHRSKKDGSIGEGEVHPMCNADFSKVYFNSNWIIPGVETDTKHVNIYMLLVPDAWKSPNNNGS